MYYTNEIEGIMSQKEFFGVNVKIWLTLVLAATLSGLLLLPYAFELAGQSLFAQPNVLEIILIAFIQYGVQFALLAYLGLRISKKIEIEPTPVLSGKTKLQQYLTISVVSGIALGLIIVLLDRLFNSLLVVPSMSAPSAIAGFLASFYGGIAEEVLLRLFFIPFLCLLIIGAMKLLGYAKTWKHTDNIVWISVILASIVFGLGHLPATAVVMAITPVVILRAVLLNGILGVVFGWLFYRKGLEFAMISHFSVDIVLHVLLPLLNYSI
jgi:membrane protease YdiL (CAAX protease family)